MKKALLLSISTIALACVGVSVLALPRGNYQKTCKKCYMDHHWLRCKCRTENGFWQHTAVHVPERCSRVQNINGYLTCTNYRKPREHYARLFEVTHGPLWNQRDANHKCPRWCDLAGGRWTGQWRTKNVRYSVCQCKFHLR